MLAMRLMLAITLYSLRNLEQEYKTPQTKLTFETSKRDKKRENRSSRVQRWYFIKLNHEFIDELILTNYFCI